MSDDPQQQARPSRRQSHPLRETSACGFAVLSEQLLADAGPRDSPQLADIPNPDTQISVGEPILTVLADGNSTRQPLKRELRERVAALEAELYRE